MARLQKPGETPNKPGEYLEVGPKGGKINNPSQVTIEKHDNKLPPTKQSGRKWIWIGSPKKN